MEGLVKGDIVVLSFPSTDLSSSKRRPAFVVACLPGDDIILAQITSRTGGEPHVVTLDAGDYEEGGLKSVSYVRTGHLFTCDRSIILYRAGHVTDPKLEEVRRAIVRAVTLN